MQFPKSVFVREIRIIPLGARVEGDFPGGVRLGATNPTKFHIDFFVNDLSKPGASTFEALGSLDYCQNGQIHMECGDSLEQPRIPTDGLVLRGKLNNLCEIKENLCLIKIFFLDSTSTSTGLIIFYDK